jgi:hypothetical protein
MVERFSDEVEESVQDVDERDIWHRLMKSRSTSEFTPICRSQRSSRLTTDATAKCCRDRMRQEIDVPEENDELAPQYPFCECQGFRSRKFDGTARL